MENHYDFLGLLWIVYSSLMVAAALAVTAAFLMRLGPSQAAGELLLLAIFNVPGIIAGVMLRRRHRWAKLSMLVWGLLNLILFPIGTALGIYTFFVLLRRKRRTTDVG